MTSLTLLPAVDVAGGRADQVVGDADSDPIRVARGWVEQGARWLHLVDLDRAYDRGDNHALISRLVAELPVPVQVSGGVADRATLEQALATGAARVNLASTALWDIDWVDRAVRRHGGRIAVGLDIRGQDVVARGAGTRVGTVTEVVRVLRDVPVQTYVVADARRDGSRRGADLTLFATMAGLLRTPVIASGGVGTLADLRGLRALAGAGVSGVVLGAALYHGELTLGQALAAVHEVDIEEEGRATTAGEQEAAGR